MTIQDIQKAKTELVAEIKKSYDELVEKIKTAQEVFPDIQSPIQSTTIPHRGGRPSENPTSLITQIVNFLSTEPACRKGRKELIAQFIDYPGNSIDNALLDAIKRGRVINGFKIKEIHPPTDMYRSFIKVPVAA